MEHLRFCGSLNIACGHAGEQGFCTLTRCPVVLDEFQAMRRHQGPTGPKGRPGGHGNVGGNMKKSTCRGCGAPLCGSERRPGKSMPCDAEPVLYKAREGAAGKIVTPNGEVLSCDLDVEPDEATGIGYISHFGTCPQAERFRKRKMDKKILDVTCGARSIWFDKHHPAAVYCDKRHEQYHHLWKNAGNCTLDINPDVVCDFTDLPFQDNSFPLVVFDPPHLTRAKETAWLVKKYGKLDANWPRMIHDGFRECMRVLKPDGVLIFKWSEYDIPAADVWKAIGQKPLFGHHSGKQSRTFWACFMKFDERTPPPAGGRGERTMNIPQEFEDVFRGVELTEDEIRTLTWIAGWESRTVENLCSAIRKVRL